MIQPEHWQKVKAVFFSALSLPEFERKSFLDDACRDDLKFRSDVESLLSAYKSDFLEDSVWPEAIDDVSTTLYKEGQQVSHYKIVGLIGRGGMGDVYEAIDVKLNRRVALKFLPEALRNDRRARKQLHKEARAIAMLEHPNICAVFGIEQVENDYFIVMQYIDGIPLDRALASIAMDTQVFASLALQVADAVAFAHSHGIIHRDIKPANIMLTPDGEIKVLDFGLAKVIEQKRDLESFVESVRLTGEGLIAGTIAYMSPEQLRGEELDYQSDIFSLGVVLFEMRTGVNPFHLPTKAETISAILNHNPFSSNHETQVSRDEVKLLTGCLEKERSKRTESVEILHSNLLNLCGRSFKRNSFSGPKKFAVAAILLFIFAVFSGSIFYFDYLNDSRVQASNKKISVAILPFRVDSDSAEVEYLASGLSRGLVDKMSNLSSIRVKDENFVSQSNVEIISPNWAGMDLAVDFIFSGYVRKRNDGFFLETKLMRVSDNTALDTNESPLEELGMIQLQNDLAGRLAAKISLKLPNEDEVRIAQKDTEIPEAQKAYLLGRYYLNRRRGDDLILAVKSFTEATNIDPSFARAWAGLADTYAYYSSPGFRGLIPPSEAANLAKAAAAFAMKLDDTLSEPHVAVGMLKLKYEWDWIGAEASLKAAISRDHESSQAYLGLASLYVIQGRLDEAATAAQAGKSFSPFSTAADMQLASVYYFKHDFLKSEAIVRESLERNPNHKGLLYKLGFYLMQTNRLPEAIEIFESLYATDKILGAAALGMAYGKSGRLMDARKILLELEALAVTNYVPAQEFALVFYGLGDLDKVAQYLNKACQEKGPSLPSLIHQPGFEKLWSDRRFISVRNCVDL